jgi:bifunctional non-homologous end joining protein LigD
VNDRLTLRVGGRDIDVSRPGKVLFPDAGITKADLAEYYAAVAETMAPHLRDRPLAFERYPDGIGRSGFFQKDVPGYYPDWIARTEVEKEGGSLTQVVVRDELATLVYLAGQACITPHPWPARKDALRRPDRIILDLDPSGDDPALVRAAARDVRQIFEAIGLVPFLMTTGSRGFHVVCPLQPEQDSNDVRQLAQDVAELASRRRPDGYTTEWRKVRRRGRVFLDYLRNGYAQTSVAPYAVRSRAGAPVATPIGWDELAGIAPDAYTVRSIPRRLAQKDDPWRGIDGYRTSPTTARRALDELFDGRRA